MFISVSLDELAKLTRQQEIKMSQAALIAPLSVSVEEAARLVGHSRSGIYEVIARGELKAFKLGKRRLILMVELKAWIERAAKVGAR